MSNQADLIAQGQNRISPAILKAIADKLHDAQQQKRWALVAEAENEIRATIRQPLRDAKYKQPPRQVPTMEFTDSEP